MKNLICPHFISCNANNDTRTECKHLGFHKEAYDCMIDECCIDSPVCCNTPEKAAIIASMKTKIPKKIILSKMLLMKLTQ